MNDILAQRMTPISTELVYAVRDAEPEVIERLLVKRTIPELWALAVVLADKVPAPITEADIIHDAARCASAMFGSSVERIMSQSRRQEDVIARQAVCYAAHRLGLSYSFIGRAMGRDHTTVMNSVSRVGETAKLRYAATKIAMQLGWTRASEDEAS